MHKRNSLILSYWEIPIKMLIGLWNCACHDYFFTSWDENSALKTIRE